MEIKHVKNPTTKQMVSWFDKSNIKFTENVREFQLPQQFPSTIKYINPVTGKNKNITNIAQPSMSTALTSNSVILSNTDYSVPCKKLRIISPNGKDLGEFNVEVRNDRENPILTITKSNTLKSVKPVMISLTPVLYAGKTNPKIFKQESINIRKNKQIIVKFNNKHTFNNNKVTHVIPKQKPVLNLPIEGLPMIYQNTNVNKKIKIYNTSKELMRKNLKLDKDKTTNDINKKYIEVKHISTNDTNGCLKTYKIIKRRDSEIPLVAKNTYKKIAESPHSVVSSVKLDPNNSNLQPHLKGFKGKCLAVIKNKENKKTVTCLYGTELKLVQECNQIERDLYKKNLYNNNKESQNNRKILKDENNLSQIKTDLFHENKHICETEMKKNIMTVIPNNKNLFDENTISRLEHNTISTNNNSISDINNSKIIHDTNHVISCDTQSKNISLGESNSNNSLLDDDVCSILLSKKNVNNDVNRQSAKENICLEDPPRKDLSGQLDIIKKAMDNVKDEELRAKALRALADCGIEIVRHVPIRPPEELKTVYDREIQTAVFGILDPKFFILVDKNIDTIQRIQQISNHNIPQSQKLSLENDLYCCNNSIDETSNFVDPLDFNSLLNELYEIHPNMLITKEISSTTNIMKYTKILDQLQKDFESVKKYDQKGRLSIHNAVKKNKIFDVQRYIMLLKQCKENIDIPTKDGMTSLELAIKHDVSTEIVNFLLQAGAQPVRSKLAYDSALILAAKKSSTLLPMLVKCIPDKKLLDYVDTEGLASLHYCCKRGNLEGIKTLLLAGADVNLQDKKSGRTPLFHALDNNHIKVAHQLLHNGALSNIANFAGQTPMLMINDTKSTFKILNKDVT